MPEQACTGGESKNEVGGSRRLLDVRGMAGALHQSRLGAGQGPECRERLLRLIELLLGAEDRQHRDTGVPQPAVERLFVQEVGLSLRRLVEGCVRLATEIL